jgi:hypothetical protein
MKILVNAKEEEKKWHGVFSCIRCGSKLEVERSDLTFAADSRDGNAYTFPCPVCANVVWISATLVPKPGAEFVTVDQMVESRRPENNRAHNASCMHGDCWCKRGSDGT